VRLTYIAYTMKMPRSKNALLKTVNATANKQDNTKNLQIACDCEKKFRTVRNTDTVYSVTSVGLMRA